MRVRNSREEQGSLTVFTLMKKGGVKNWETSL